MINTEEGFRSALEQATQFFESPPVPGSQDEREFATLLDQLESYRPPMPARADVPTVTPEQTRASSLMARAAALLEAEKQDRSAGRFSDFPQDGRGIGPTTGV